MLKKLETLLVRGRGTQENCSASWLTVSGFMVMRLVFRLSLANRSDSGHFLVAHALLSQDGCQWEGFWEVAGHVVSPFDLSPNSSCWWFLTRTSCGKITCANGCHGDWPGWVVSVSVLPLTGLEVVSRKVTQSWMFCFWNGSVDTGWLSVRKPWEADLASVLFTHDL